MNISHPFRRRRRAERTGPDSPVESALRHSLASNAMDAPPADDVARRILAAVDAAPDSPRSRHAGVDPGTRTRPPARAWGLPLVAAAVVAAIVAIGIVVASYHPDSDDGNGHDAASHGPSATHSMSSPTVAPTTSAPAPQVTGTSGLTDVKIVDLTFYHENSAFALATAQCPHSSRRCTFVLQTTGHGDWTKVGGPTGFTGVEHLRFANDHDGFAFGPSAFYVTTDAGQTWTKQSGGAVALESLGGNVIRIRTMSSGCRTSCAYEVQKTSGVSTDDWMSVDLPGGVPIGDGVQLSRGGTDNDDVYLLVTRNPSGSAPTSTSTLYESPDDGASWNVRDQPCSTSGGGSDGYQVAAGVDGNVSVLCRSRATGAYHLAVSDDGGQSFSTRPGSLASGDVAPLGRADGGTLPMLLSGYQTTLLAVAGNGVSLSANGGRSWTRTPSLVGSFDSVGFQSTSTARAVTSDGSEIWTTRDGGRSWHRARP